MQFDDKCVCVATTYQMFKAACRLGRLLFAELNPCSSCVCWLSFWQGLAVGEGTVTVCSPACVLCLLAPHFCRSTPAIVSQAQACAVWAKRRKSMRKDCGMHIADFNLRKIFAVTLDLLLVEKMLPAVFQLKEKERRDWLSTSSVTRKFPQKASFSKARLPEALSWQFLTLNFPTLMSCCYVIASGCFRNKRIPSGT